MKTFKSIAKTVAMGIFAAMLYFTPIYGQTSYQELAQKQEIETITKVQKDSVEQVAQAQKIRIETEKKAAKAYDDFQKKKTGLESYVVEKIKDGKFDSQEIKEVSKYYDDLGKLKITLVAYDGVYTQVQKELIGYDTALYSRIQKFDTEKDTTAITSYFAGKGIEVKVTKHSGHVFVPVFPWWLFRRRRNSDD